MSDKDDIRARGIQGFAVVTAAGVASGGSATVNELRAKGMSTICAVDASGDASGTSIATLRTRGIRYFCPVTQAGVAADATTKETLRTRGIPFFCLVTPLGVAQVGGDTIKQLRERGIPSFCPLDQNGAEIPDGGGGGQPAPMMRFNDELNSQLLAVLDDF